MQNLKNLFRPTLFLIFMGLTGSGCSVEIERLPSEITSDNIEDKKNSKQDSADATEDTNNQQSEPDVKDEEGKDESQDSYGQNDSAEDVNDNTEEKTEEENTETEEENTEKENTETEEENTDVAPIPTIVELAIATPDLSILTGLVVEAGLAEQLANPDANLTVFAPTNTAFAKIEDVLGTLT